MRAAGRKDDLIRSVIVVGQQLNPKAKVERRRETTFTSLFPLALQLSGAFHWTNSIRSQITRNPGNVDHKGMPWSTEQKREKEYMEKWMTDGNTQQNPFYNVFDVQIM